MINDQKKTLTLLLTTVFLLTTVVAIAILSRRKPLMQKASEGKQVPPTRSPAVAGAFYPAEKEELLKMVDGFLESAPKEEASTSARIIVVPHAGYPYSGQTAAYGFATIPKDTKTVILIGGSHQAYFQGALVYPEGGWETPLGVVGVNDELAKKIIAPEQEIFADTKAHAKEHSLEVQLPFLQRRLSNFTIVPILLGETSADTEKALADRLASVIDEKTAVVISTDLSHYPNLDDANKIDQKTIEAILSLDISTFDRTISEQMQKGAENLVTCACGEAGVRVGLYLANKLGLTEAKLLKYTNSGELTGDPTRVVGYAAIAILGNSSNLGNLSKTDKQTLLKLARDTLEKGPPASGGSGLPNQKLGAFVTLNKHDQLRGCVGIIETDKPLWQTVQEMTITAATKDNRFEPVTEDELKEIEIEISVLTPKRRVKSADEIELGKHGVWLQQGFNRGVFLPQVATETGWSKEEFLSQLCSQKAGLPPDCWKDPKTEIYVFEAEVFGEE